MQRQVKLVDSRFTEANERLQRNGILTMALTNCYTEKLGPIASVRDWRIDELKCYGYHFDQSWKDSSENKFENISTEEVGTCPLSKDGVLFTNNVPKRSVLDAFLEYSRINPEESFSLTIGWNTSSLRAIDKIYSRMMRVLLAIVLASEVLHLRIMTNLGAERDNRKVEL